MSRLDERGDAPHELGVRRRQRRSAVDALRDAQLEGRPTRIVMRRADARAGAGPRPRSSSVPEMPTGRTGAPVRVASRETPGLGCAHDAVEAARALGQDGHHAAAVEDGLGRAVGRDVAAARPSPAPPRASG